MRLMIPASQSLKEKRFVLKSLKDQIGKKFNVSIAEVDHHDKWQLAELGLATVTNDERLLRKTFDEIIKFIERAGEAEVLSHTVEIC